MPDTDERPERTRVRPVDPRLLRYASASRGFFVAIAAVGALQTVVIVAFAWLMTAVITGVIAGRPWEEISGLLTALAVVVIVRGVLLWLREVICARAAARVEAQLRAQLLGAIGRLGPDWLAGRNTARLAVTAGRGLEALDTYFARYLPQLVLTVIATPIIIAVMWWQDWISGLTVILTIPLIPLFMVLIGLATRAVQQQQWQTLGTLAARFADTVRGLSTLKIFGRQHRAAASIERVTDAYRKETMRVLRVSFLSGFALELLASISVAIIAVSIGFRLIDGSLGLTVGLFVLLLAPEAYLPLRQVGVQFHAAAEGVAATEDLFEVLDAAAAVPGRVGAGGEGGAAAEIGAAADRSEVGSPQDRRSPRLRGARVEVRGLRVRRGEALLAPVTFTAEPGTVTLIEGPSGSGKSSLLAALRGAASFEGDATVTGCPCPPSPPRSGSPGAGSSRGSSPARSPRTSRSATRTASQTAPSSPAHSSWRRRATSTRACRSACRARGCRAGRRSAWRSPARSSGICADARPCSPSTSRAPPSTPTPRRRSGSPCAPWPTTARRCCSSRTAARRAGSPTTSCACTRSPRR